MIKATFDKIKFIKDYVFWILRKPKFPKTDKILLHIGSGYQQDNRFINIDARPLPNVHIITHKIHKLKMFKDNSVDMIYVCHIMEHIQVFDIILVLKEFYRILKPNGILRVSVPDFDKIINIYNSTGKEIIPVKNLLLGGQDFEYNYHYSVYNKKYLTTLLKETKFKVVYEWNPKTATYYTFHDWASKKCLINGVEYEISLNLEAVK